MADTVEVTTGEGQPEGSIIWLHGLGADGHDFEPIVAELRLPADLALRFVFPHAPVRPVTINGGMAMRAWFDILSLDRDGLADDGGVRESAALLEALIDREQERGIAAENIVLAGFSQGGAIALHVALRTATKLAGLMALSTYLPASSRLQHAAAVTDLPVYMAHGTLDPVLPIQLGREAADAMRAAGFTIEWHEYPMPHAVCAEEIAAIRDWLLGVYARK